MDRQNLIQRLVARKLQPAASRKAICGACIGGAQNYDKLERLFLYEVVDDPPLNLQRHDFKKKGENRQTYERDLVRQLTDKT